jgi:hypothetical protein
MTQLFIIPSSLPVLLEAVCAGVDEKLCAVCVAERYGVEESAATIVVGRVHLARGGQMLEKRNLFS